MNSYLRSGKHRMATTPEAAMVNKEQLPFPAAYDCAAPASLLKVSCCHSSTRCRQGDDLYRAEYRLSATIVPTHLIATQLRLDRGIFGQKR